MNTDISSKINIGIPNESLQKIVSILNTDSADEYVLLTKTKNYHWNVIDSRFTDLHKFLEEQYELLEEMVDELAERIRAIGGKSIGTLIEFTDETRLSEVPKEYPHAD